MSITGAVDTNKQTQESDYIHISCCDAIHRLININQDNVCT